MHKLEIFLVGLLFTLLMFAGVGIFLFAPDPAWASGIIQSAYTIVENAGTPLTQRNTINCTGSLTCSDSGGKTVFNATSTTGAGISSRGAFSSEPTCNAGVNGSMYLVTDSGFLGQCDGSTWSHIWTIIPINPPISGYSFSVGCATNSSTTSRGFLLLINDGTGTCDDFWNPSSTTVPGSGTFRLKMRTKYWDPTGGDNRFGIFLEDDADGKAVSFSIGGDAVAKVFNWTNITTPTFSATAYQSGVGIPPSLRFNDYWIAMLFNTGDSKIYFQISPDGQSWQTVTNLSTTAFLTTRPEKSGVYFAQKVGTGGTANQIGMDVLNLEFETGTVTQLWLPL